MTLQKMTTLSSTKTLMTLGWSVLFVWLGVAMLQAGEGRRYSVSKASDFGPSPDQFDAEWELNNDARSDDSHPSDFETRRTRGRDPARQRNSEDDFLKLYQKRNRKGTDTERREDDSLAAPAPILRRTPARLPGPELEVPNTPAPPPAELTLDQKITRRYQDPRVIRVLTELTGNTGEAFYREVSQMIDNRHIEPTSYAQRNDQGLAHLKAAVANAAFQQAAGIRPTPQQIRSLRTQLDALQDDVQIRNQADAVSAMRQAARLSQQALGLNPGAVYFEFVYASLDSLDKYSMLLPPEKSGEVNVGLDENVVGIGVEVAADTAGLKIVKTITGGPAAEATLRKGDLITAVNGRSLRGVGMGQAVDLITGPAGTPVKLSLRRDQLVADLTLIRRPITVQSVSEVRMLDEASHVGYIKLDQFAESSARELDAALWKLHNAGMETLVFDLRGNPGGYLTTAIEISDRFLPAGTIVSTRGRTLEDNSQESAKYAETWKTPLVVLIDHQSASASEIFAAAIQENGRGVIVGETSYGKGTVQTLFPLRSVTAGLRLTTAKFYSPDGRVMAGAGVTPDIRVRTGGSDDDAEMLQAALEAARDPRLQSMAQQLARPNRTGMRSFEVATTFE